MSTRDADVEALVTAALLAPSADNCQPWRFAWDGERLTVSVEPDRGFSPIDVARAALWIALGAALTNMRVLADELGLSVGVELVPDLADDVAARIRFTAVEARREPLTATLAARCTNRRPYRSDSLAPNVQRALREAAGPDDALRLWWIEEPAAKRAVARLAAQFDRLLFEDQLFHRALFRWVRWTRGASAASRDGLPLDTLELSPVEWPSFWILGRWPAAVLARGVGLTRALPLRSRWVYGRSAAFGLLTVDGSAPAQFVRVGEAFERLWLTTGLHQVALQPLGGLTFLVLRHQLTEGAGLSPNHRRLAAAICRELAAHVRWPESHRLAMAFRVGLADPPVARTLRRPTATVLTRSQAVAHA